MSTPKATTDDLKDEGFIAIQFGGLSDSDFVIYLGKVLQSASLWVEQKCTAAAYAAATLSTYAGDCAQKAEVNYASAVLFRRRVVFYESNAASGNNKDEAMVLAELRKHADMRLQDATYWLGEAMRAMGVDESGLYDGTGVTSGFVETGRYPLSTAPGGTA
ncbi:hypothetical protein EAH75_04285 [Rhodanobacter glycinis]|uniref:hypothetical protein n=1 Tax=Rhodanobacter glycinis TaxID=582702 RepID=UPI00112A16F1|nr:hypothetical protein [Rhodanobacter glycinis]TPG50663.1 hypothetical protein EAH75_04285 [Rhodanobacter glycinis]